MFSFLSRLFKGDSLPIAKDTIHCVKRKDDEKYGVGSACERKPLCDAADLQDITENYFSLSGNECDYYRNYAIGHNCFGENEKGFSKNDYNDCYNYKRYVSDSDSDECDERFGNYVNTYFNNFNCDSSENENGVCSNRECDNDKYDYENSECEDVCGENEYCGYFRGDENYENLKVDDSVSEDRNCAFGHNCFEENEEDFSESDDGECDNYERDNSDERYRESYAIPYFNNFCCDDSESESSESSDGEWDNDAYHYEEDSDCVGVENECGGFSRYENYDNAKFDDSESEDSECDSSESDGSEYDHSEGSNEDYESDCSDDYVECDDNDTQVKDDEYSSDECDINLSVEHRELVFGTTAESKEKDCLLALFRFYDDLHDFIRVKYPVSEHAVKQAIQRLIYNYCNLTACKTPEELNFNDINTCIGYLHRYGICHAAMVCHAMIKVIGASTAVTSLLAGQKLNLVCLGSGPGNDFIGLVVALISCHVVFTELDVTVVDKSPGWEVIFKETVEMLTEAIRGETEDDIASFIEADLVNSATWNDRMKDKLKRAHIVTLVKVLSNIAKVDHFETLKNIIQYMEDDALLILIDCPLPFMELYKLHRFLLLVYKSEKERFSFSKKKTRFGYPNIKKCSAYVRVYRKRNSVATRRNEW